MSFLTELVPFNVCIWPRGKYKIDQREQENYSGESLWLCELLLDIVVLPDRMAWFTIYSRAWGMRIQTFLLKIPGADGGKKYRLDLVQMLRMLHIFWLLHEGINNTNSSSSTDMRESSQGNPNTRQIWDNFCTLNYFKVDVLQSGVLLAFSYGDIWCSTYPWYHTRNREIALRRQNSRGAGKLKTTQFFRCFNMQFCPAILSMLKMGNFTFQTDK